MTKRDLLCMRWEKTLNLFPAYMTRSYKLFDEIVAAYEDKHRVYHSTDHLLHAFTTLDMFFRVEPYQLEIELALWYHDFVYVIGADHNEGKSAQHAVDRLTEIHMTASTANMIKCLIIETSHLFPRYNNRESSIITDVDLAILGESPDMYAHYEQQIRREYAMYNDSAYQLGRRKVLLDFYNRPRIFRTPEMISFGYEDRARENLARVLGKAA
jgi:predicted metal-dependent HD superfamily phosphohydrolase